MHSFTYLFILAAFL